MKRRLFLVGILAGIPSIAEARGARRRRRRREEEYMRYLEERELYRRESQETRSDQLIREWGSYK